MREGCQSSGKKIALSSSSRGSAEPRWGLTGNLRIMVPRRHHADLKAGSFEQGRSGMTGNLLDLGKDIGLIRMPPGRGHARGS